jgi:hypothetical protein
LAGVAFAFGIPGISPWVSIALGEATGAGDAAGDGITIPGVWTCSGVDLLTGVGAFGARVVDLRDALRFGFGFRFGRGFDFGLGLLIPGMLCPSCWANTG